MGKRTHFAAGCRGDVFVSNLLSDWQASEQSAQMVEPSSTLLNSTPRELGVAARCGEKMLGCLGFLARPAAPILTRQEAIVQGFGAALWRVFISFVLPMACFYLALAYEQLLQWLGPHLGLDNDGHFSAGTALVVIPVVAGCLLWSFFLIWSDAEDKWHKLHWLYFGMFAAILLCCYSPMLLLEAAVGIHFSAHWAVHAALKARAEDELVEKPPLDPERQCSGQPDLLKRYGGVGGFDAREPWEAGKSGSDDQTD